MAPVKHLIGAACLAAFWSWAAALSISEAGPPVGLPPVSFEGVTFVDQRGCLYIRTGPADAPVWVPRVTRQGDVMCGFEPSLAAPEAAPDR